LASLKQYVSMILLISYLLFHDLYNLFCGLLLQSGFKLVYMRILLWI